MKAITTILCFHLAVLAWAQNDTVISLPHRSFDIINRQFYVERVLDQRQDKSNIGYTMSSTSDMLPVNVEGGLQSALEGVFSYALPKENGQFPVTVAIKKLTISETSGYEGKTAYVRASLEFYYQNQYVYKSDQYGEMDLDAKHTHSDNMLRAIEMAMKDFGSSYVVREIAGAPTDISQQPASVSSNKTNQNPNNENDTYRELPQLNNGKSTTDNNDRDIIAVGYQIGGFNLIGIDYEMRVSDYIGIHAGAGLPGYTIGVKVHTGIEKDSPFFNFSLKDGGFGLINAAALEYGWRWVGKRTGGFGFHGQVGLAKIMSIDPDFEKSVFGSDGAPSVMLSLGLGVSW